MRCEFYYFSNLGASTESNPLAIVYLIEDILGMLLFFYFLPAALLYFHRVVSERDTYTSQPQKENERETYANLAKHFRAPLLGCFDDAHYLVHGFCCALPRQADTLAAAGVMEYWHIVFISSGLIFLQWLAGRANQMDSGLSFADNHVGRLMAWTMAAAVFASFRARFRGKLGGDSRIFFGDFVT